MACLGLSGDVCHLVMRATFKGANQFLSMTNVELRKVMGLVTPVERLVVRNALKRSLNTKQSQHTHISHIYACITLYDCYVLKLIL